MIVFDTAIFDYFLCFSHARRFLNNFFDFYFSLCERSTIDDLIFGMTLIEWYFLKLNVNGRVELFADFDIDGN